MRGGGQGMGKRVTAVLMLIGVAGVACCGWWLVRQRPPIAAWLSDQLGRAAQSVGLLDGRPSAWIASGFVEAEEVAVTTELGGRIAALHAGEGDEVAAGQPLAHLDDSLLQARMAAARADLALAEATRAQVEAGVRQETLDYARAVVGQAVAGQGAALIAWQDAQAMVENPQDLELAIVAASAQLGVLTHQERQARAAADAGQAARALAEETAQLLEEFEPQVIEVGPYRVRVRRPPDALPGARYEQAVATYASWSAWTELALVEARRGGVESQLEQLRQQRAQPLTLRAAAHAAEAQYRVAAAQVGQAQASLDGLSMGATPEQVAAAAAQVDAARAALLALEVQLAKLTLKAPIAGLVLECTAHEGEVALPGAPLMTVADLGTLTVRLYVPEDRLGEVHLGQQVSVTVDAFPGRSFPGKVRSIATQAEFAPRSIQMRAERVAMVFAVTVELPNPDHALRPGMVADVVMGK